MKKVDYIVVGLGLAGLAFCEQLRKNNKSFIVFDDDSQISSKIAGGVYNPVILKRFTLAWMADIQIKLVKEFYEDIEKLLNRKLDFELPIHRKFYSIEEQNDWFVASDRTELSEYLSSNIVLNENKSLKIPHGTGKVNQTGYIDTNLLLNSFRDFLDKKNLLLKKKFDYLNLNIHENHFIIKDIEADKIIFAEGFGIKKNPFFNDLPLNGTKGEILIISAPNLKVKEIIKSSVFLIPLGKDLYYVGATYEHHDKSFVKTSEARLELIGKLEELIACKYEIIDQLVGIRPTTKDRKPLVGTHPENLNLGVLNGLGTRGVMIAPYVAEQLYNHIENGDDLNAEINIKRFYK